MQLIYLYIGDIGRDIVNQEICFSDEYRVKYLKEKKALHISHETVFPKNIYGKNILGVDLLVGRNGSGKSTIMNLLGLCEVQRRHEFPIQKDDVHGKEEKYHSWFAVYHLKKDLFCIEGYDPELLTVLNLYSRMYEMNYVAVFRFDFKTQKATFLESLDRFKYPHTAIKVILRNRFLHYSSRQDRGWYGSRVLADEGAYRSFPRYHIATRTNNAAVLKYLCESLHDRQFQEIMEIEPKNVTLTIGLKNPYGEFDFSQREDEFSKCIYGEEKLLTNMPMPDIDTQMHIKRFFSSSQSMVLRYLEILIAKKYDELNKSIINQEKYNKIEGDQHDIYLYRKNYLLAFLKSMMGIYVGDGILERPLLNERDWELINLFCEGMEEIEEKYYINGSEIEVPLIEYTKDVHCLDKLMRALDENSDENIEHEINHEHYIRTAYHNLSSGEMDFVHLYASLSTGINRAYGKGTCVLLLDEPDVFFHPEWSRRFIESLTKVLSSNPFRKFDYQLLITTHSPILLADVPTDHIHCISRDKDGNAKITDAKYGFLSNINTILLDSMFVNSSFGSFAEKYVNSIIKKLNKISNIECNDDNKHLLLQNISDMEESMRIINEPVIQKYLESRIFSLREKIYSFPQNRVECRIRELMEEIRNLERGEV